MSTAFQKFTISSTLEYSADHFALSFTGSEPFRNKTKTDTVALTIGFLDSLNVPQTITFIDSGPVDEFEIVITPNSIVGTKHGRDEASFALDGAFRKRYYRYPRTAPPDVPQVTTFGQVIPIVPFVEGQFFASFIAKEIAHAVGLKLQWGLPDYILQNDFFAAGRAIDSIKKLVRPFTFVAPFQADIFVQGTTMFIRPRRGVDVQNPDYTISLKDMKRESVTLRVRKTQKYGLVTLRGQAASLPTHLVGVEDIPNEFNETTTNTQDTFDDTGTLISRVVTESTFERPSNNLLTLVKSTYTISPTELGTGLSLSAVETTTNNWDTVGIDRSNPIAQKKLISQSVISEGYDTDNSGNLVWVTLQTITTGYSYDDNAFQTGETTITKKIDRSTDPPGLVIDSMIVKTMRDTGQLLTEYTTETYTVDTSQGAGNERFVLDTQTTQQQGGYRPGGPGRAQPILAGSNGTPGQSIIVNKIITPATDPFAVDVNEDAGDLTRAQMIAIIAQFEKANFIWEYEAIFTGVNMPWIQRGQYLRITDVTAEDGSAITLPVMLILEANSEHDESGMRAKSKVQIRCIGWSKT